MSITEQTPKAPMKTLALDDLIDDFEPRPATAPKLSPTEKKTLEKKTTFPSREPKGPSFVQVNCSMKAELAERLKAFVKRDEYTTWSYGQAIEFLLDQYERKQK
ncbi:hypothetical protein [Asticcacaulis benevestitus]|uniref:Uncharacterized protein n=1 Tax=Asticcacaulis benevestitus DSM 16100 = ATCC BAA-896 TaxID=1121022 RepID=V4PF09_9CAUL|nr:hypothetical protein [Asticcacaulis benevestitus]ESQ92542.1 hypothetical protein ABENE_07855 [Asticcacaulis benevestitus DSM 16100 = ATCC BAA-896]